MTCLKLLSPLFLLPLISSCVANQDATENPTEEGTPAAAPPASAADGQVELRESSATKLAGRFTKDGTTIGFDFEMRGDTMHVLVTSAAGAPLIDSAGHEGGGHTTRMLGGRLVVEGAAAKLPEYTGDRAVERELHEMPEGAAINALEPALEQAQVNTHMLPTAYITGKVPTAVGYGNCNTWVPDGTYATCGSVFLGWTSIYVENCSTYSAEYELTSALDGTAGAPAQGWYDMGGGSPPWYCPQNNHGGWWWGANITFRNSAHLSWSGWWPTIVPGSLYFGH